MTLTTVSAVLLLAVGTLLLVSTRRPKLLRGAMTTACTSVVIIFGLGLFGNPIFSAPAVFLIMVGGMMTGVLGLLALGARGAQSGLRISTYACPAVIVVGVGIAARFSWYMNAVGLKWWSLPWFPLRGFPLLSYTSPLIFMAFAPLTLVIAAVVVLVAGLSSDPTKTYYVPPVRVPAPPLAAPAVPPMPLYTLATMPDGTQQMVALPPAAYQPTYNPGDAKSGGFAALGFFFPVVGLILFLVWKDQTPLKARSAGKGALAGVITYVGLSVLSLLAFFIFVAAVSS
ncbi:MAG: hypothetical protein LBI33_12140 [Propionibacteriaceae bacterium]|nr:hypothetical protein [Propionibacteriaceae bacterium]